MNKFTCTGRLTRDPELAETNAGVAVCRFSIAADRGYKNANGEKITDFFNCFAWRGLAETIARYTRKGDKLLIVGVVETRSYEDRDGNKRTVTEINVQEVEFLTPRVTESNDTGGGQSERLQNDYKRHMATYDGDDELPF